MALINGTKTQSVRSAHFKVLPYLQATTIFHKLHLKRKA